MHEYVCVSVLASIITEAYNTYIVFVSILAEFKIVFINYLLEHLKIVSKQLLWH